MSDFNTVPAAAHRVELVGRERLVVSGVEDVDRFDETGIVMSTTAGTLVVTGEDLHIGKLSLDGGSGDTEITFKNTSSKGIPNKLSKGIYIVNGKKVLMH